VSSLAFSGAAITRRTKAKTAEPFLTGCRNSLHAPRSSLTPYSPGAAALDALAPETRLLVLIDEVIFTPMAVGAGRTVPEEIWNGTAEQLESRLGLSDFGHEARRLLNWPNAAGTYLGRLAAKHPDRVKPDRTSTARKWILYRPKAPMELVA
jgi:hypothetical protein